MKSTVAFMKKEWMEYYRTGKLFIVLTVFILFGIMNPAIAKLTPVLMEQVAKSDAGFEIYISNVDAGMSWTQFYKNIPMALIMCVLIFGSIITAEIQKKTLIPVFTKGLSRSSVFLTKSINVLIVWTLGYWMCYGITFFYNDFYWDNSIINNLLFSAFCYWLYGIMILSVMMLFSSFSKATTGVMIGTGAVYFLMSIFSIVPKIKEYIPNYLTAYTKLFDGDNKMDFVGAIVVACLLTVMSFISGIILINKREM